MAKKARKCKHGKLKTKVKGRVCKKRPKKSKKR